MTITNFLKNWKKNFPDTLPIGHNFRTDYAMKWVRFYNLVGGKRYPENENNWLSLLKFQNALLTDILGENNIYTLVAGEYFINDVPSKNPSLKNFLKQNMFQNSDLIDLHSSYPNNYDFGTTFLPYFMREIWNSSSLDTILREVADDKFRIFFISENWDNLIYLYDGGIDVIFFNDTLRRQVVNKYELHLSKRKDGL